MAKKRRTPDEALAAEVERQRQQDQRVREARARAKKTHADRGAVVARHVGEVLVRLAATGEHAGHARAIIDWAVAHMPARGRAARERWRAAWDPAAGGEGGATEVMIYAIEHGIAPEDLPCGPRWEPPAMQARGWVWRDQRWFPPQRAAT